LQGKGVLTGVLVGELEADFGLISEVGVLGADLVSVQYEAEFDVLLAED